MLYRAPLKATGAARAFSSSARREGLNIKVR
jgi:hypothetical protein